MTRTPTSLSAVERGNPPPRRKSCAACTKAKRRCDLRQPACLRCSQRKIVCSYPPQTSRAVNASGEQQQRDTPDMSLGVSMQDLIASAPPDIMPWERDFDFNVDFSLSCEAASTFAPFAPFEEPPSPAALGLFDVMTEHGNALAIVSPAAELDNVNPMPIVRKSALPAATLPRSRLIAETSQLVESRLRYSIDKLIQVPEMMLRECRTPWSHPALYHDFMPTSMEDALAACALHQAKNHLNTPIIERTVESKYHSLLSSPMPTCPRELLARTQSLLLYQIMFFFDSSHVGRTVAEETAYTLTEAALKLSEHLKSDFHTPSEIPGQSSLSSRKEIPIYPLAAARAAFEAWTFQESVRRTLLMSFYFLQAARLVRASPVELSAVKRCIAADQMTPTADDLRVALASASASIPPPSQESSSKASDYCDERLALCECFMLSSHLWHAKGPVEFAMAWRTKPHLLVTAQNFIEIFRSMAADDVEDLGKMLMTSALGVEEAKGWLASIGGSL
ncbi:hypothetical protein F5Y15DRAFT_376903 [Xylariaceae sp. FL0016]|nr:hypothetical protein F5Y15DRAFT_376903 [Xylariaceae sp. FL0016]